MVCFHHVHAPSQAMLMGWQAGGMSLILIKIELILEIDLAVAVFFFLPDRRKSQFGLFLSKHQLSYMLCIFQVTLANSPYSQVKSVLSIN